MKKVLLFSKKQGESLGIEELLNGTFDSDLSGWTVVDAPVTWSASYGGSADFSKVTSSTRMLVTSTLTSGVNYKLTYDVKENINCIKFQYLDGASYVDIDETVGSKEVYFTSGGSTFGLQNVTNNSTIIIDNVSLKEVL